MRLVSGAIKQAKNAHGEIDAGSVAKRVAAELWARTTPDPHPDAASWVRHVRGQLGLTQKQFADILGVTQVTVARWESGERSPRRYVQKIQELARG